MRVVVPILAVLLIASTALNMMLWRRLSVLQRNARTSQALLAQTARSVGVQQAEHDFASGEPRWYVSSDFGVPVPADKPGRRPATTGCLFPEYHGPFVEAYNKRMDELFVQKSGSADRQGYPDGAANGSQPIRSETNRTSPAAGSRR